MKLTEDIKAVILNAQALSLITMSRDGSPHPIVVGGKSLDGDNIVIKIYKMEKTQENLKENNQMWALAFVIDENGPKGFRFAGTASLNGETVFFSPDNAEAML